MDRYITVPEPLTIYEVDGKTPARYAPPEGAPEGTLGEAAIVTFEKFIEERSVDDAFVSETPEQGGARWTMPLIVSAENVRAAFRGKAPGTVVKLNGDSWQRLRRATENGNYNAFRAHSVIPFMRIVSDAKTEEPGT
jgi:hypothetical protein